VTRPPLTVVIAVMALAGRAPAAPAKLAALAPGPNNQDARQAVAVGPNGQAYEPDGKGAWIRHHPGGLADDVVRATRAGALVIAGVESGPPYAYRVAKDGAWNMIVLGLHAKAIVGRGPRATAAFGKLVFGLDTGVPVKLADAPDPIALIAAAGKSVVVQTDKGLARLDAKGWKPIANAPKQVIALLDDRWALVDRGLLDLRANKLTAWPSGFRVASVVAVTNELVVAAGGRELVTLKGGKLERTAISMQLAAPIVSVVADKAGRVVVATRDGEIAVRDKAGAWTAGELRDDLPAARPGSPPAESP